jgi:hypothetical protein
MLNVLRFRENPDADTMIEREGVQAVTIDRKIIH